MISTCYTTFKTECICNNLKDYKLHLFYLVSFLVNNIHKNTRIKFVWKIENDKNFLLFYKLLILIKKYLWINDEKQEKETY